MNNQGMVRILNAALLSIKQERLNSLFELKNSIETNQTVKIEDVVVLRGLQIERHSELSDEISKIEEMISLGNI